MVTVVKAGKHSQCNSCLTTVDVYEVFIGPRNNNRMCVGLCKRCMKSLVGQYEGTYKTGCNGLVYPTGTFNVGPFTCKVLATYKDKVEISVNCSHVISDYTLLSFFTTRYGMGILAHNGPSGCVIAIPLENIVERGGLL